MIIEDYISRKISIDTFYDEEVDDGTKFIKFRNLKYFIFIYINFIFINL